MGQVNAFKRDFANEIESRLGTFVPLIQVITGPRQVGKTTAVQSFLKKFSGQSRYLSFDNPGPNAPELIRFEWEKLSRSNGHKVLVLDEIQNVPNWASLIKELYDQERSKKEFSLAVLGSSALELLTRGEESLLGRFEIIRAPHWNMFETAATHNWSLETFLQFGGYPILGEILDVDSSRSLDRCQKFVRDAILEPVITRDILSLQPVLNTALFRQVIQLALSLPCEEISFAKLLGQLSERGSSASVKNYLELMEKAFLIKLLYRFSEGKIRLRTSSPKIVPLAPALSHAFVSPERINTDPSWFGHMFEAAIISRFSELGYDLFYWSNSKEDVDLVIQRNSFVCAIEIKSGKSSDWRGLNAFKRLYPNTGRLLLDRASGEEFLVARDPDFLFRKWVQVD